MVSLAAKLAARKRKRRRRPNGLVVGEEPRTTANVGNLGGALKVQDLPSAEEVIDRVNK